jgi:hypothetical protein
VKPTDYVCLNTTNEGVNISLNNLRTVDLVRGQTGVDPRAVNQCIFKWLCAAKVADKHAIWLKTVGKKTTFINFVIN